VVDFHGSSENQPRRYEEREGILCSFFVSFVSSWLIFMVLQKTNHEDTKSAKAFSVLPSFPSFLRG